MTPKFDEPQSFVDGNIEYSYTLENLTAPYQQPKPQAGADVVAGVVVSSAPNSQTELL